LSECLDQIRNIPWVGNILDDPITFDSGKSEKIILFNECLNLN